MKMRRKKTSSISYQNVLMLSWRKNCISKRNFCGLFGGSNIFSLHSFSTSMQKSLIKNSHKLNKASRRFQTKSSRNCSCSVCSRREANLVDIAQKRVINKMDQIFAKATNNQHFSRHCVFSTALLMNYELFLRLKRKKLFRSLLHYISHFLIQLVIKVDIANEKNTRHKVYNSQSGVCQP